MPNWASTNPAPDHLSLESVDQPLGRIALFRHMPDNQH